MSELKKDLIETLIKHKESGKPLSREEIKGIFKIPISEARYYARLLKDLDSLKELFLDPDMIEANSKLSQSNQKFRDMNRIERKIFREKSRMMNVLSEFNKEILKLLKEVKFDIAEVKEIPVKLTGNSAIIQLSDTHFNELVDLQNNRYDFEVASKRMQKFASEAKLILRAYGVDSIVLAMTGDLINSDRRLDEKLNMATNRMSAAMIAVQLLQYFLQDLASSFHEVQVVGVTGNESRVDEFGFTDLVVTDNYDSIIFNFLEKLYEQHSRIKFIRSNPSETVITVNGKNVLLFHGTTVGQATQRGIQQIIGKYANKGVLLDYALFGHIHFCEITDLYARSGSLVGNNTYSDQGLNLVTKASQNIHTISSSGQINNHRIELDDTSGYPGYPIQAELAKYNAKSASKLHKEYKVIEIVKSPIIID